MIDQSTLFLNSSRFGIKRLRSDSRKLVVIPIENSFLYVVPLYLKAEGTNFPQLKRVMWQREIKS